jgi:hypothetical protein
VGFLLPARLAAVLLNVDRTCRAARRVAITSQFAAEFGNLSWPHFGTLSWPHLRPIVARASRLLGRSLKRSIVERSAAAAVDASSAAASPAPTARVKRISPTPRCPALPSADQVKRFSIRYGTPYPGRHVRETRGTDNAQISELPQLDRPDSQAGIEHAAVEHRFRQEGEVSCRAPAPRPLRAHG